MDKSKLNKIIEKILKDIRIGFYQLIVLKIIVDRGQLHGYAIRKAIQDLSSGRLNPSESTIYDTLKKLEKYGLIEGFWAQSPLGGPMRKYYKAKKEAKMILDQVLKELEELNKIIKGSKDD